MKILDTDTCIGLLRGNKSVQERRAADRDEVVTTWITASELFYEAARSLAPDETRILVGSFLTTLPVLGLDGVSVRIFGEVKALLERKAIAAARQGTIVTGNRRHYERIPGLVEDWLRP